MNESDADRLFRKTLDDEKLDALAEFAAGAGHEINNPLAVISGRAQLLLAAETDPQRRHDLATIHAQALRVREMISDLMLFARPPEPTSTPLDAAGLRDQIIGELAADAAAQQTVLTAAGEAAVAVTADPRQLAVAWRALAANALEALGRGGRVELGCRRRPGGVELWVEDDGPGIPPAVRTKIFDPFYSARQAGRGIGMGLPKAWQIARRHGGDLRVEAPAAAGARFVLSLPQGG